MSFLSQKSSCKKVVVGGGCLTRPTNSRFICCNKVIPFLNSKRKSKCLLLLDDITCIKNSLPNFTSKHYNTHQKKVSFFVHDKSFHLIRRFFFSPASKIFGELLHNSVLKTRIIISSTWEYIHTGQRVERNKIQRWNRPIFVRLYCDSCFNYQRQQSRVNSHNLSPMYLNLEAKNLFLSQIYLKMYFCAIRKHLIGWRCSLKVTHFHLLARSRGRSKYIA